MNVGERIAQLRAAYGISQYALWKHSGIAQGALSQYESGKKLPGIDTLERICESLGITMAEFFTVDEESDPHWEHLTKQEQALLFSYRQLSTAHRKDAQLILSALVKGQREESAFDRQAEPDTTNE